MNGRQMLRTVAVEPEPALRRRPPFSPTYQRAIEMIGRRWTGAIVRSLLTGPARYRDISLSIPGLSDRLLTERLKALEADGLVERVATGDRRAVYRLTPAGEALAPVVNATSVWADRWLPKPRSGRGNRS